ncbi:myb-like protein K [Musca vetustissima]|uniref:myb-like protein K n=1 Tax=Musca vetustissima TaxID=27455 RepID=UPI002AB71F3B|nr:myb-like protein K [Musca vetustissima]
MILSIFQLTNANGSDLNKSDDDDENPKHEIQNLTEHARTGRVLKYARPMFTLRRRQPIQKIRSRADHFPLRPQLRRVHNGVLPASQQPQQQLRYGYDSLKSSKYINSKGALPYGANIKGSSSPSLKQQLLGIHPNGLQVPALSHQYVQNFKASPAYNGQVAIHPPPVPVAQQATGNKPQKQQSPPSPQQQQQLQKQQQQNLDNSYPKYLQSIKSSQSDPAMPYPDFKQYPIPDQQQMQKYNEQHDKYLQQQKYLTPRDPVAYYQQQYQQLQQQPQSQHFYQQHQQAAQPSYSGQQPAYSAPHLKPVQQATTLLQPQPQQQPSIPIHEVSEVAQPGFSSAANNNKQQQLQPQAPTVASYGPSSHAAPGKMYSVYEESDMTELHNNDYQTAQLDSLEKEAQEYLRFMNTNEYFLPKRDPNYKQIDEENDRRQQLNLQQQQQHQSALNNYGSSQASSVSSSATQYQSSPPASQYYPQQQQQIYYGHHPDSSVAASGSAPSSSLFKEPIQVSKLFYQDESNSNGAGPSTVVRTSYQTAYNSKHFGSQDNIRQSSASSSSSSQSNRTPEPLRFEFTERDAMVGGIAYTHAPKSQYKYKAVEAPVTPRITIQSNFQTSATATTVLPTSAYVGSSIKPITEVEDDPEDGDDMQEAGSHIYGRQPLLNKNKDSKVGSSTTTTEEPPSEQKDTEEYCERICAIVEDENEEIVCGSDGYMYTSEAQMECYASCLRIDITIQGKGSCSAR